MTGVRHATLTFIRRHFVARRSQTAKPLPEHNGPEKPGRPTAPKGAASPVASQAGHLAFAHSASAGCAPADVLGRRFDTSSKNQMHTRDNPTTSIGEEIAPGAFDAFDTLVFWVSNGKSRDGEDHLTRLTDLTANQKGVYVPGVRPRSPGRSRSPAALATYPSRTVKSVKSVNSPTPSGGFPFTPNRQPWCQIDTQEVKP